jgi:hypothetical protein
MVNHIRDLGAPDPPPKDQLAVKCELGNMNNPTTKADLIITDLSMLGFRPRSRVSRSCDVWRGL